MAPTFVPGDTAVLDGEQVTVVEVSAHNAVVVLPDGTSGVTFIEFLSVDPWGPARLTYEDELTAFVYGKSAGPYEPLSQ